MNEIAQRYNYSFRENVGTNVQMHKAYKVYFWVQGQMARQNDGALNIWRSYTQYNEWLELNFLQFTPIEVEADVQKSDGSNLGLALEGGDRNSSVATCRCFNVSNACRGLRQSPFTLWGSCRQQETVSRRCTPAYVQFLWIRRQSL